VVPVISTTAWVPKSVLLLQMSPTESIKETVYLVTALLGDTDIDAVRAKADEGVAVDDHIRKARGVIDEVECAKPPNQAQGHALA
jgi:hypothetical protein